MILKEYPHISLVYLEKNNKFFKIFILNFELKVEFC